MLQVQGLREDVIAGKARLAELIEQYDWISARRMKS